MRFLFFLFMAFLFTQGLGDFNPAFAQGSNSTVAAEELKAAYCLGQLEAQVARDQKFCSQIGTDLKPFTMCDSPKLKIQQLQAFLTAKGNNGTEKDPTPIGISMRQGQKDFDNCEKDASKSDPKPSLVKSCYNKCGKISDRMPRIECINRCMGTYSDSRMAEIKPDCLRFTPQ